MALIEREKELASATVKYIEDLCGLAKSYSEEYPQIKGFSELLEVFAQQLDEAVKIYLTFLSSSEGRPEEISRKIFELRIKLEGIYNDLRLLIEESIKVPREIYYLIDYLLEVTNPKNKINYILKFGSELAMLEFYTDFLKYTCHLDETLPELFTAVGNGAQTFYVIFIPHNLASRQNASLWPLIIHEVAHAIDRELKIVDEYLEYPKDYGTALIIVSHGHLFPDNVVERARNKLYAYEYIADLISCYWLGPIYPLIFLKQYPHVYLFRQPGLTHPDHSRRISLMLNEINTNLGFEREAEVISSQMVEKVPPAKVMQEMPQIKDMLIIIREKFSVFDSKTFEQNIKNSLAEEFGKNMDEILFRLNRDFVEGKPFVTDPLTFFHLIFFRLTNSEFIKWEKDFITNISKRLGIEQTEFRHILEELISDCIRLYIVKRRYERKNVK